MNQTFNHRILAILLVSISIVAGGCYAQLGGGGGAGSGTGNVTVTVPPAKPTDKAAEPAMRDEYDFSRGVRGKHARSYAQGANVVVLEADVAKVKQDNSAKVTLDAYGDLVVFEAAVVAIDPAETMIEGVATYKTTFVFSRDDARIKSGMTANIDVATNKQENVLAVPQRSVGVKNGISFVLVKEQGDVPRERSVVIGLRGSDGMVEVREGLKEGDQIADSPEALAQ